MSGPIAEDRRTSWVVVAVLALLWTIGLLWIDDYGVHWDEALGDLFFGERYYSYWTSLDESYLELDADPFPADRFPDLSMSPFRERPWEFYGLINTAATALLDLLSRRLDWLDPFDAFHAFNLVVGSILVAVLLPFLARRFGLGAALLATLMLMSSPRMVVHLLVNTKDFPSMVLFTLAVLVFLSAWTRGSSQRMVVAGLLSGLALSAKANGIFLPAIFALTLLVGGPGGWHGRLRALAMAAAAAAVAGIGVFFLGWPYLWGSPLESFLHHLEYVSGQVDQVRGESLLSPTLALVGATPVPFLVLALAGLVVLTPRAWRREPLALVVWCWVIVVWGRLHLPGAVNFDGVRHFLELLPALAIAAAAALQASMRWVGRSRGFRRVPGMGRTLLVAVLSTVVLLPGWLGVWRFHPHELAYWNMLVGGLPGAFARGIPQAGDYWGLAYRQAMEWANQELPRDANVVVPIAEHAFGMAAQARLRPDLRVLHTTVAWRPDLPAGVLQNLRELSRREPVYVLFVRREDWDNELTRDCRQRLAPLWTIQRSGEVLLAAYRYLPP